jgi:N6-adenosine-specific RNA methylase IME4
MELLEVAGMRYGTIEADPPWKFRNPGAMHGANNKKGSRPTYKQMSNEELLAWKLPVEPAEQSHLWLWCPGAFVPVADLVIEAWGFRPTGAMRVWKKPQPANGYWFGNDCEYVRLGVRGEAYRADAKRLLGYHPRALFEAPPARTDDRHSSKPDLFYEETIAISPGPYVSLFQRVPRAGWHGWGDEYPVLSAAETCRCGAAVGEGGFCPPCWRRFGSSLAHLV